MSYGKVHDVFWDDDKIEELSDRAALLALFLITGPHRNAIGCFRLGTGAISDLPRFAAWGFEGISEALSELVGMGFIVRDDRTGWTFIRNALKHDPITSANVAVHALALVDRVPKNSVVYQPLIERLAPQLEAYSKVLAGKSGWPIEAPTEGVTEGVTEAPSKGLAEGLTKPLRTPLPEPEPEPEQEPKKEGGAVAHDDAVGYAFEGRVVRVRQKDFDRWRRAYPRVRDMCASLQACDDHLVENPRSDGKWFFAASAWLKRDNDRAIAEDDDSAEARRAREARYNGV